MFKDRDVIPDRDDARIDFNDRFDANNPFCERNFMLKKDFSSPALQKALSVAGLSRVIRYGEDRDRFFREPRGSGCRLDAEEEARKALVGAFSAEFYDDMARRAVSERYRGPDGGVWNIYGIMSGVAPAGPVDIRFQVFSRKLSERDRAFAHDEPRVFFCRFAV